MQTAKPRAPSDDEMAAVKALTGRLRQSLGESVRQVILFGSRARGDARADADWDLLVLLDELTPSKRRLVEDAAFEVSMDSDAIFAVAIAEQKQFQSDRYEPLFVNVRREGIQVL